MKQILLLILISGTFVCPQVGNAQESPAKKWSLEDCINYAIAHNIDLKQKEKEQEQSEIELSTSKLSWLPNLNANIGQNFDFGRSPNETGIYENQGASNTSLSVNTGMPLFDGLKTPADISAKKLNLKASVESLNKAKNDLSLGITSYYIQVLFNKELLEIAKLQVELTEQQVIKTEALYKAERIPESQLYDIKAQLANDEVTLTEAQNNVNLALLELAQSLELERQTDDFDIVTPEINDAVMQYINSLLPPDEIYERAITFRPEIKEQQYLFESQQQQIRVAQSGYIPNLSLNAGINSGFYSQRPGSFGTQLDNNLRTFVGFSLSIPIFNRLQVKNSVRTAKLGAVSRELMIESTKKTLYKEIQQAFYNATASQKKLDASEKSVIAGKEAYAYAEIRYNEGKSSVFEYNEAKTKYAQSLAELAKAKYDFILRSKVLDFYNGTPIKL